MIGKMTESFSSIVGDGDYIILRHTDNDLPRVDIGDRTIKQRFVRGRRSAYIALAQDASERRSDPSPARRPIRLSTNAGDGVAYRLLGIGWRVWFGG